MTRLESRQPAGWGHSMAGSTAINIYSASRLAGELTDLEPGQHSATHSLRPHTQTLLKPSSPKLSFPTQCNYHTVRQAGTSDCCFWPHSFLCQGAQALTTTWLLMDNNIKLASVHFYHVVGKMSWNWLYFSIMPQMKWLLIMTAVTVLSSFDYLKCN